MEFTAKQIAEMIGGRVEGNENAAINSFAKIEEGKVPVEPQIHPLSLRNTVERCAHQRGC